MLICNKMFTKRIPQSRIIQCTVCNPLRGAIKINLRKKLGKIVDFVLPFRRVTPQESTSILTQLLFKGGPNVLHFSRCLVTSKTCVVGSGFASFCCCYSGFPSMEGGGGAPHLTLVPPHGGLSPHLENPEAPPPIKPLVPPYQNFSARFASIYLNRY